MVDKANPEELLERVRALVTLASSPSVEEARTAAYKACEIIREEKLVLAMVGEDGRLRGKAWSAQPIAPSPTNASSASPSPSSSVHASYAPHTSRAPRPPPSPPSRAPYARRPTAHDRYGGRSIGEVLQDTSFVEDLFDEAERDLTGRSSATHRGHISPDGRVSLCGAPLAREWDGHTQTSVQYVDILNAKRMRASQALKSLCPSCVRVFAQSYPT